jgi:hypothetical protein
MVASDGSIAGQQHKRGVICDVGNLKMDYQEVARNEIQLQHWTASREQQTTPGGNGRMDPILFSGGGIRTMWPPCKTVCAFGIRAPRPNILYLKRTSPTRPGPSKKEKIRLKLLKALARRYFEYEDVGSLTHFLRWPKVKKIYEWYTMVHHPD